MANAPVQQANPVPNPTTQVHPGVDTNAHANQLHKTAADAIFELTGVHPGAESTQPAGNQTPIQDQVKDLMSKPKTEYDLHEIINAERGRARTEPSKNFLKLLFQKVYKKKIEQDKAGQVSDI